MSKHLELAKKLKALADRGIGGEKINAEKMLANLLLKHNLTIEDIEGEKTFEYFFKLKPEDVMIWSQIVGHVNAKIPKYGEFLKMDVKAFKLAGNYMINCTPAEYIEIECMLGIYPELYKRELKIFNSAFCHANDLLIKTDNKREITDLSKEELERILRIRAMASKIKSETFRKQLQ